MPIIGSGSSFGGLSSQGSVKAQLSALIDAVRQLIGNANINPGSAVFTDPLSAPFHLYVDYDRGSDVFVTGDYNSFEATGTDEEIIAQKLKRVRNQRLAAGYTHARPFKTLNRAVLEAAIITSLAWYTFTDERAHRDCVIIHMGSGPQPVYNHPGTNGSAVAISAWADGKVPTWQELIAFNNDTIGSVLLPRGAAFHGEDLRKCVLVPQWAPAAADIAADYSNIRTVVSLTPDIHAVDFTFRDPIGQSESLHLLYGIGYASQAELDQFYSKVRTALGTSANLSAGLAVTRLSEYQVVGPITGTPARAWDTVKGASAYPERISLRSEWGMGGLFIDGRKLAGLRSTVTAQYTLVSQQTDRNSLQIYSGGSWITPATYQAYLDAQPDSTRTKPERMHCQVLAVGECFVSTVSMFGVCAAFQVYADLGAEVTSSNGNTTFGDVAALARGYKSAAFSQDRNWAVEDVKVPLNPSALPPAVSSTSLGIVSAVTGSDITLTVPLAAGVSSNIPAILEAESYSLSSGNYIWVENPAGPDWRALLTGSAWSTSSPDVINITAALAEGTAGAAPVPVVDGASLAIGKRVYIRRVVDSRNTVQRRASLKLVNTAPTQIPPKGYVLQTSPSGTGITRALIPETTANTGGEVLVVNKQAGTIGAVTSNAEITVRRAAASVSYAAATYYRKGQIVKALNKHWQAKKDFISSGSTPDPAFWGEVFKAMPEQYNPPDKAENEAPQIKFDVDTDPLDGSTTCGINWATIFTSPGPVRDQYRSGVDVLGVYAFLRALGFSDAAAWAALAPRTSESARLLDPASGTDFPTAPSGGAASGRANWSIEFRRPTTITLNKQTFDVGAGMGVTYSKALPSAQKTISPENLFSSYFTSQGGGRAVVSGVNEQGQEVTIRGLTDLETGELTLAGDIGGSDIDPPQILENGRIVGTVDFSGVTSLTGGDAVGAQMRTTRAGFGQLATYADYENSTASAADDAGINGAWNKLVNIIGLNRLLANRGYLRVARQSVVVYWDPVNGVGSTTNRLLALQQYSENPPESIGSAARSLKFLADYISVTYQAGTVVEYRLCPGICLDTSIAFSTVTVLRSWNPATNAALFTDPLGVDFYTNAITPSLRNDKTKNVIFPTRFAIGNSNYIASSVGALVGPCMITSKENITLDGIVTWDLHQSLSASTADIPNGYHGTPSGASAPISGTVDTWRNGASYDEVLDTVWACACALRPAGPVTNLGNGIASVSSSGLVSAFVNCEKSITVRNVAVGAIRPVNIVSAHPSGVGSSYGETVFRTGDTLEVGGLYVYGNTRVTGVASADAISKGALTAAAAAVLRPALLSGQSFAPSVNNEPDGASERRGHSYSLFASQPGGAGKLALRLGFGQRAKYTSGVTPPAKVPSPFTYANMVAVNSSIDSDPTFTLDVPINNIFFCDYANGWDRADSNNWKLGGPSIITLIQNYTISLQGGGATDAPWFTASNWQTYTAQPYAGFRGKLNEHRGSRIVSGAQERLLARGLLWSPQSSNRFSYATQFLAQLAGPTTPALGASTAISPWRMAGLPLQADNPGRVPRYWQPNGFGRVVGPDPAANVTITFRADGGNLARLTSAVAHNLVANDVLRLANAGGALPVAFNTTTDYRVVSTPTTTTFELALGIGETAITPATTGTGTHTFVMQRAYWSGPNLMTESIAAGIDVSATTGITATGNFVI